MYIRYVLKYVVYISDNKEYPQNEHPLYFIEEDTPVTFVANGKACQAYWSNEKACYKIGIFFIVWCL